jgi:hypothetical protein
VSYQAHKHAYWRMAQKLQSLRVVTPRTGCDVTKLPIEVEGMLVQ